MENKIKIISNYKKSGSEYWNKRVIFIDYQPRNRQIKKTPLKAFVKFFDDVFLVLIYLKIMIEKNEDVLVAYRDRASGIFAMIQGVFGRRIPFVMLNLLWRIPENKISKFFLRLKLRLLLRGISRVAVFASHEPDGYVEHFNLPKDKFIYIPYYFTPASVNPEIKDGDYIFSGGHVAYRDYWNLIEAVRGLDIKCIIATQVPEWFAGKNIPHNVEIVFLPEPDFFKSMAESRMVVIPLKADHFRSTGQRTYLNAMLMAKPVIVCDEKGIHDYMENKKEGIVVSPGDTKGLRDAIQWVIANREQAAVMGQKGRERAQTFTIDRTMGEIVALCEKEARLFHESSHNKKT